MNDKTLATMALLAATALLQACSIDRLYYQNYAQYEADLAEWEACEERANAAPPNHIYCGMPPHPSQYGTRF